MVVLNVTEDLIGKDIHGEGNRTACGTLLALIAGLQGLTADLDDFRQEKIPLLGCLYVWLHRLPLDLGRKGLPVSPELPGEQEVQL